MNVRHYAGPASTTPRALSTHGGALAGGDPRARPRHGGGHLTIDFHHEIRAGQLVLIKGAVTRVGTKSFNTDALYEPTPWGIARTQKTVEVCFDTPRARA